MVSLMSGWVVFRDGKPARFDGRSFPIFQTSADAVDAVLEKFGDGKGFTYAHACIRASDTHHPIHDYRREPWIQPDQVQSTVPR